MGTNAVGHEWEANLMMALQNGKKWYASYFKYVLILFGTRFGFILFFAVVGKK